MSTARDQFIVKYKQDVIDASCGTGLFPSVVMAQMIIESADSNGVAGNGITFLKANNAFGIKADSSWHGPTATFSTPKDGKPISVFRVYPTVKDSIIDHTKFLEDNNRYKTAGIFSATTPEQQARELGLAHYSESPTYPDTIIAMINGYHLKDLDKGCQKKK